MTSHGDQLKNPLYRNWVRGCLALKYLKQGLVDHIDQSIKTQHEQFIRNRTVTGAASVTCGLCTLDNVLPEHSGEKCRQKTRSRCFCSSTIGRRKCPLSHCSLFMDIVIKEHWLKDPIWNNSDPTKWLSDYWQYAKCFLSVPVKDCANSPQNADASDLLSIAINNTSIRNNVHKIDNFISARQTRNKILHSYSYEMTGSELHDVIQTCKDVLLDKTVVSQVSAQNAIKDLNQLENDQIIISTEDVEEMRIRALTVIEETRETAIESIDTKTQCSLHELNKTTQELKEEIEAEKRQAVNIIKGESIAYLNEKKNDIINECFNKKTLIPDGKTDMLTNYHDEDETCLYLTNPRNFKSSSTSIQGTRETSTSIQGTIETLTSIQDTRKTSMSIQRTRETSISIQDTREAQQCSVVQPCNDETVYNKTKEDLQNDLILFYEGHNEISTIRLTPMSRKFDAPLLQMFVLPDMTFKQEDGLHQNPSFRVNSYKDILFHESRPVRNVFVSGDASTGKSVLARHMCLTWCQARKPRLTEPLLFSENDLSAFEDFDFLFFVDLENAKDDCDLHDIITKQIINELSQAHIYTKKDFLHKVLSREKCIIIVDSLDKWSHPVSEFESCTRRKGILPHLNGANITVVAMTRQWKLNISDINFKQKDMNVEVLHGSDATLNALMRSTVSHLNSLFQRNKNEEDFLTLVQSLNFEQKIPLTRLGYVYYICQWFEDNAKRKSRNEMYGFLTDVLLEKFNCSFTAISPTSASERGTDNSDVTFERSLTYYREPKQKYVEFLLKTGQLSLESMLFTRSTAVDIECAKRLFSSAEIKFGLDLGIFDVKSTRCLTFSEVTLSFQDPTFQAYIAAHYLTTINFADFFKQVTSFPLCKLRHTVVSDFLVFLAGLNPNLVVEISKQIYKVNEQRIRQYRLSSDVNTINEKNLKLIQDVLIHCFREMSRHYHQSVPVVPYIEDIFIDESFKDQTRRLALNKIISNNKEHIKSVTVYHQNLPEDVLNSTKILSVSSPQKLAILPNNACANVFSYQCCNSLIDVIQSFMTKGLRCVSLGGFDISQQIFESVVKSQRFLFNHIRILETGDNNSKIPGCRINLKNNMHQPYLYLSGNASTDTLNKVMINQLLYLKTIKLQNISLTTCQLCCIGRMHGLDVLSMWHVQVLHTREVINAECKTKSPNTFDFEFNRKTSSIVVRGKVPNEFIKVFFANNSKDLQTIKVVYAYLTFQSLYSLCRLSQGASIALRGITIVSEEDKCTIQQFSEMRRTFKCEYLSANNKLTFCGFAPENVYGQLMKIYSETVMQIELKDVFLSEQDLKVIAEMKIIDVLILVNITRKANQADQVNQLYILNTFDLIYSKQDDKIYVCGSIDMQFYQQVMASRAVTMKEVDIRYVMDTTGCLQSLENFTELQEFSLFFRRSVYKDTAAVMKVLSTHSDSLQYVQLGCHLLSSKPFSKSQQQYSNTSISEIFHSSCETHAGEKYAEDFVNLNDNFYLQWDNKCKSFYSSGKTPEEYIHNFLQKLRAFESVCLKGVFLSASNIQELHNCRTLKTLNLTDILYEETDDIEEISYNKEVNEDNKDDDVDFPFEEDDIEEEEQILHSNRTAIKESFYASFENELDENHCSVESVDEEFGGKDIEIENEELTASKTIDKENPKEKFIANTLLSCHIEFDHLQEKLLIRGDITDRKLFETVLDFCQQSKKVRIEKVKLRHKRRKELLSIISQRREMTTIEIDDFKCSDHEVCRTSLPLNLSEHEHLQVFELKSVDITDINLNANQLLSCKFGWLINKEVATSILRSLPHKTETLELINIRDSDVVNTFTDILPTLKCLKNLELCWVNMFDRNLLLFPCLRKLERLVLWNVNLTLRGLRSIMQNASKLNGTVQIRFKNCKLVEGSESSVRELKEFLIDQSACKSEEEIVYQNGYFSGRYSFQHKI